MATTSISASMAGLFDSLTRYGQVQAHLGAFAVDVGAPVMLRGYTRLAGRRYDSYLDGLSARPIAKRATVARLGGDAQTGLIVAEALTSDIDDDERDDLTERFSVVSLESWETGPAAARQELFAALDEVTPGLADWLKAAWENIDRDGYKAASIIANSTVECIDRTLRVLAPVEAVTAWVTEGGAPKGWLDTKTGLPTRATKIRYAMRNRSKRDAPRRHEGGLAARAYSLPDGVARDVAHDRRGEDQRRITGRLLRRGSPIPWPKGPRIPVLPRSATQP